MRHPQKIVSFFIGPLLLIAGCSAPRPAPVSDARPQAPASPVKPSPAPTSPAAPTPATKPADTGKQHTIQRGDTLISIAFQYGLDYRELAAWNNIENPNVIRLGETLRLSPPDAAPATSTASATPTPPKPGEPIATPLIVTPVPLPEGKPLGNSPNLKVEPKATKLPYSDAAYAKLLAESTPAAPTPPITAATAPTAATPTPTPAPAATPAANNDEVEWSWPVKGKILSTFTEANKGVDIAGTRGAPVLAAAPGKVIYSDSGLRGYGRLIIIKHNNTWLSAYAHNEKLLVMEGQDIKKGQKIAEMGSSDADQVKLHFEVRKQGKPVDPLKYLPAQ